MKAHILGAIVLFVAALAPSASPRQAPAKTFAEVSDAEYEVLSAFIAAEFTGDQGEDRVGSRVSKIVIVNATQSDRDDTLLEDDDGKPLSWKKMSGYLHKEVRTLQGSTLDSFRDATNHPAPFSPSFHLPVPYELVAKAEIDAIFKKGGWWMDFYKKYPDSQGLLTLSRVGYSADRKQAMFHAKNHCGGKCGTGSYVVMEKTNRGWKVAKEVLVWIS